MPVPAIRDACAIQARALAPEAVFLPPDPLLYKRETDVLVKRLETLSPRVEASGELAGGGQWASNTAAPIKNYFLEPPGRKPGRAEPHR